MVSAFSLHTCSTIIVRFTGSTGAYGYPHEQAAPVVSAAIESFLRQPTSVTEIRLVFFDNSAAQLFLRHHSFSAV